MKDYEGQRVVLIGLGLRSGVAVAQLLDDLGANLVVSDLRPAGQLRAALEPLEGRSIEFALGGHPSMLLDKTDLVVVSPGVPYEAPILKQARERHIPVIGELEVAAQICQAPILAITGTKGKSTTTRILSELLRVSGMFGNVLVGGNIGLAFSRDVRTLTRRDCAIVEVSSFQLETISQFHPHISVMTNIEPDHLDRHGSMSAYIQAKSRIFLNQTADDFALLNHDDPLVRQFASQVASQVARFSMQPLEGADTPRAYLSGDTLLIRSENREYPICTTNRLQLPGQHNVANTLAACLAAFLVGMPVRSMGQVLASLTPSAHTLETVRFEKGLRFVNDSKATNVAATRVALAAFPAPIHLIMGGYDKGNDYALLVPLVREKVGRLILMGPNTVRIFDVLGGLVETEQASDMPTAVRLAGAGASPGTTVLLSPACASFDLFEDYRHRGEMFRQAVLAEVLEG